MMLDSAAPPCLLPALGSGAVGPELAAGLVSCALAAALAWIVTALLGVLKVPPEDSIPKGSLPQEGDDEAGVCTPLAPDSLAAQGSRSDVVDNARFWLVGLVIASHNVGFPNVYLPGAKYFLTPLVVWTAAFHIPGLVFVSGMCSRGPLRWTRLFTRVFAPYCISRFIQWSIACKQNGKCGMNLSGVADCAQCLSGFPSFASETAGMDAGLEWYLLSLCLWRIAAAGLAFCKLRPQSQLMLAFGIGIYSGYHPYTITGEFFILYTKIFLTISQRTMSFFPFFMAGLLVTPDALGYETSRLPRFANHVGRCLVGGILLVLCLCAHLGMGVAPLENGALGDFNYDYVSPRPNPEAPGLFLYAPTCGFEQLGLGLIRAGRYMLSFMMVGAFLVAMPVGPAWICEAGRYTLYPYLLQQWPMLFQEWFFQTHLEWGTWSVGQLDKFLPRFFWVSSFAFGFLFTYLATLPYVRWIFGPIIEPDWIARVCICSRRRGKEPK